ncbi:unnamed protein product [Linum trigynum]|uniref:Uncharacterized protein n=1 Tax=Linum trigynum TaxID=586398 RepID=A0AAV2CQW1_9ROSI
MLAASPKRTKNHKNSRGNEEATKKNNINEEGRNSGSRFTVLEVEGKEAEKDGNMEVKSPTTSRKEEQQDRASLVEDLIVEKLISPLTKGMSRMENAQLPLVEPMQCATWEGEAAMTAELC